MPVNILNLPGLKEGLIKSVTPAKAGVQSIENTGFRPSPE